MGGTETHRSPSGQLFRCHNGQCQLVLEAVLPAELLSCKLGKRPHFDRLPKVFQVATTVAPGDTRPPLWYQSRKSEGHIRSPAWFLPPSLMSMQSVVCASAPTASNPPCRVLLLMPPIFRWWHWGPWMIHSQSRTWSWLSLWIPQWGLPRFEGFPKIRKNQGLPDSGDRPWPCWGQHMGNHPRHVFLQCPQIGGATLEPKPVPNLSRQDRSKHPANASEWLDYSPCRYQRISSPWDVPRICHSIWMLLLCHWTTR